MKGSSILPLKLSERRDKDEESLVLFRELHRREKDRLASLLQPISDEFDPKAGALYRIASGRKGAGLEFVGENNRNDYDWLKTPPATPLFPSLEMEANAPQAQLVVQREIPILQPLSRFSSNSEPLKRSGPQSKSKPNTVPRSTTPGHVQRPSTFEHKNHPQTGQKLSQLSADPNKPHLVSPKTDKAATEAHFSVQSSKSKTTNRGVSPSVRSRVPAQIPGFSSETPPNLRTNRATSATRGRPMQSSSAQHQKPEANPTFQKTPDSTQRPRRQSCSPSVTRGRKEGEGTKRAQVGNNNVTQIFGSRMVDKVLNARKLGLEEREPKSKPQTPKSSWNNGRIIGGFVRTVPKTKSSQDRE